MKKTVSEKVHRAARLADKEAVAARNTAASTLSPVQTALAAAIEVLNREVVRTERALAAHQQRVGVAAARTSFCQGAYTQAVASRDAAVPALMDAALAAR